MLSNRNQQQEVNRIHADSRPEVEVATHRELGELVVVRVFSRTALNLTAGRTSHQERRGMSGEGPAVVEVKG